MSKVFLCGDPGSTHNGSLDKAKDLVSIGADVGLSAVKFQMLTPDLCKSGNIMLDWDFIPELIEHGNKKGVEVFASVFDRSGYDYLAQLGCKSLKFAYSQALKFNEVPHVDPFETFYVSCDVMTPELILKPIAKNHVPPKPKKLIRLYCLPLYPIPYVLDFEGLFPRFDGFSSHCLGISQELKAVEMGAKVLEFHYRGPWDSTCPDHRFAKSPEMAAKLVREIVEIGLPKTTYWHG